MKTHTNGLHHITAIASNGQRNYDFYTKILGLRFVKKTVNFDDPMAYHLYYGDETGAPGTALTFFIWPEAPQGRNGIGEITSMAFRIPTQSISFWVGRLAEKNIPFKGPFKQFGENVLMFDDPDGMHIELIGNDDRTGKHDEAVWESNGVTKEHAIRDMYGFTIWVEKHEISEGFLSRYLGYTKVAEEENTIRLETTTTEGYKNFVHVRGVGGFLIGQMGIGTIHHAAFRVADDAAEIATKDMLQEDGFHTTEQIDRNYFHSIYFREPGGALYEIATDKPGFLLNETIDELGTSLKLPAQYEHMRAEIEANLDPIHTD